MVDRSEWDGMRLNMYIEFLKSIYVILILFGTDMMEMWNESDWTVIRSLLCYAWVNPNKNEAKYNKPLVIVDNIIIYHGMRTTNKKKEKMRHINIALCWLTIHLRAVLLVSFYIFDLHILILVHVGFISDK